MKGRERGEGVDMTIHMSSISMVFVLQHNNY
jgi:hypothetical protein